jgi:hypothetical protein
VSALHPSPEETLPWLVRDASGRAVGPSHVTREDAEHAAARVSGGSVWRDSYSAANAAWHRRFLGMAPVRVREMTRFGAWGDAE